MVLVLGFGALEMTAQPGFCSSCHYMKPYYDQWKKSSHSKVSCVKCHYPPGFRNVMKGKLQAMKQVVAYVTKTYSTRAYAEIEDASCLRKGCHEKRLLDTAIIFKQNIKFNHKHHLEEMKRGKKLRCTSCHSQMVFGEHIAVTETVCFLCHFKDRVDGVHPMGQNFCTQCHTTPAKDIEVGGVTYNHEEFVGRGVPCQNCHLEAVKGTGKVAKSNCYACHAEQERLQHFEDGEMMHYNHVTNHKVACNRCHEEISHSVTTTSKPLEFSCETCHSSLHTATKDLYMGKGGRGIPAQPGHMFLVNVDCIGCHVSNANSHAMAQFIGQTSKPSEKGCIKCHGDDVAGMMEEWKATIAEELAKTKSLMDKAQPVINSGAADAKTKKLFGDAKHNYELVKYGKGVHNMDYALNLLNYSNDVFAKITEGK